MPFLFNFLDLIRQLVLFYLVKPVLQLAPKLFIHLVGQLGVHAALYKLFGIDLPGVGCLAIRSYNLG